MRNLLLDSMFLLCAAAARADVGVPAAAAKTAAAQPSDDAYRAAFKALKPEELSARKIDALPQVDLRRIDASAKVRSASFGHKTTLLVPSAAGKREFYVEYGKSTNRPAQLFGPFSLR